MSEKVEVISNGSGPQPRQYLTSVKRFWRKNVPGVIKYFIGSIRDAFRWKRVFKKYHLDIIHINETNPTLDLIQIGAKLAKIPVKISTIHLMPV